MKVKEVIIKVAEICTVFHYVAFLFADKKNKFLINTDVDEMNSKLGIKRGIGYYLLFYPSYRNLFLYRLGGKRRFLSLILPKYKNFYISAESIGGYCFVLNHPYSTIINAKTIGEHFNICQLTTIGNKRHGDNKNIPIIGDNVSLGANVIIIGNIRIGNNVVIGAGAVVVKDIVDGSVVVGNPGRIL